MLEQNQKFSKEENLAIQSFMNILGNEYTNEVERWKVITDYVLPHIKYSVEKNKRARTTSIVQSLLDELVDSYASLCFPVTKKWFYVITKLNKESDDFEISDNKNNHIRNMLQLQNCNFFNELKRVLESALGFGQALLYIDTDKNKDFVFKIVQQYMYRIYYRNDVVYFLEQSKKATINQFKTLYPDIELQYDSSSLDYVIRSGFVEYKEFWINTEVFPMYTKEFGQQTDGWLLYIYVKEQQYYNSGMANNDLYYVNSGDDFYVPHYVEQRKDFPFVYVLYDKREESSYGKSKLIMELENIQNLDRLEFNIISGIDRKVNPPLISAHDNINKISIASQKIITVQARDGNVSNSLVPFMNNANGEALAQQKIDYIVSGIRKALYLDDLLYIANPQRRVVPEDYINSYADRINTITPFIINIITYVLQPIMTRVLLLLINENGTIFNTEDAIAIKPPILSIEETLSKTPEFDLFIKKLSVIANIDPSIFDKVNFDVYIEEILQGLPQLDRFIRNDKEVQQIRENRAKNQNMLAISEAKKNEALANKHNMQAQQESTQTTQQQNQITPQEQQQTQGFSLDQLL